MKNFSILLIITLTAFSCYSQKHTVNHSSNLEIVKSTYEENSNTLQKYLAEDATWTEAKGFPYGGTYTGYDEVVTNIFSKIGTEWTGFKFNVEDYVASDDKVIAFGTYSGTYKKTNKSFTPRVSHIWKLKDGKIINFEQIVDSKPVVDAMQ